LTVRAIFILLTLMTTCAPMVGDAASNGPASAQPVRCSSRNSEKATISQIAADPGRYQGHCVAVGGVMQWQFLFENVDGLYLQPPDTLNPSSNGLRIGLDNLSRHFGERYQHVSVFGRVQDCETVRSCVEANAAENEIVMVSGYCHSFNGPYIFVEGLTVRRGPPFERRLDTHGRDDYGDLEPATEDWPHREKVESLAQDFLRALRSKDRERLAGMHFRDVGLDWKDDEAALLSFLLKTANSPFADIRTSRTPPQQIILVQRSQLRAIQQGSANGDEADDYTATVCFCRERSCTGRWPIATFDADNIRERPYACTQVGPYLDEGRWVPHFVTQIGRVGLAEPRVR